MRKRSISLLAAAVAAAVALTSSVALAGPTVTGPDGNTQSIATVIAPRMLPKKALAPATLKVVTKTTSTTAATGVPSPAVRARIDFDKAVKLFTRGLPTCNPALLQNVSTEIAEQKCGRAKIGSGKAHALLPVSSRVLPIEQTVTAFNGARQGGKPTVLLHSYGTTPLQTTLVLVGKVGNYGKQGYGPRLDVQIPLIAGGTGALTDFAVKINRKWTYRGKRVSFISAACDNRSFKTRSVFTYLDGVALEALHKQSCTPAPRARR